MAIENLNGFVLLTREKIENETVIFPLDSENGLDFHSSIAKIRT
jgi:hypothetical protein